MSIFGAADFDKHEQIVFCNDEASGLKAIIAIHSTALGPAAGGCRMWPYENESDAIQDALRLSRGMSYKNAMAGLPLGGGKAVIIADPKKHKSASLLRAFGRHVDRLGGNYISAEDVGISINDMEIVASETRHVSGLPKKSGHAGGDPSPKTAYGVYLGILAAVGFQTNETDRDDLQGFRVAVQGLGSVGYHLCRYLHEAGTSLLVSDIDEDRLDRVCAEYGATAVATDQILFQEVDILAPCALGAILNQQTIPKIDASIIAGAANNQLATDADGALLAEHRILYAPDYVVNAGGIINVAYEHLDLGNEDDALEQIQKIGPRLREIFQLARTENQPTNLISDRLAQQRLSGQTDRTAHAA
jgi:leucine dehydrogenase